MGKGVDFNRIFFGRHERGHRSATAAILVFAVILAAYAYTNQNAVSTETQATLKTETQEPPAISFCDNFKSDYTIPCNKAVSIALADTPGTVTNVSIGTRRIPAESEGKVLIKPTELWLIDISLDKPFYDEKLNEEIKLLRVGIGTDENSGAYREIIK